MREYLLRLLEQWKCILLFTVVVAAIFCSVMHARSSNAVSAEKQNTKMLINSSTEELLVSLDEHDRDLVASAYKLYTESSQLNDYIHNAPIMNLDAYNVRQLKIVWAVKAEANERKTIVAAYNRFFHSKAFLLSLVKCYGEQYKETELVDYVITDESMYSQYGYSDTVGLTIILTEDVNEENVEAAIISQMDEERKELSAQGYPHELTLLIKETATGKSEQLIEIQEEKYRKFVDYNNRLVNTTNIFTSAQANAYNTLLQRDKLLATGAIDDVQQTASISKKIVGMGVIIGVCLYAVAYFLYLLLSGLVHDPAILETNEGLKCLGEWDSGLTRKSGLIQKLTSDSYIYKKHHQGHIDKNLAIQQTVATVVNAANHINAANILLVDQAAFDSQIDSFISEIALRVTEKGITVNRLSFADRNSDEIAEKSVAESDGVILLIDGGRTKIKDCHLTLGQCSYYDTPVMGFIYTT